MSQLRLGLTAKASANIGSNCVFLYVQTRKRKNFYAIFIVYYIL